MDDELNLYSQVFAIDCKDFNTCFYCGCVATVYDLSPPLKYAEFFFKTREDADFYKVPACGECGEFLKNDKSGLLGQRMDRIKKILSEKYKKALRIYEMWNVDEVDELDYQLKHSVKAGLILGEESYRRCKYKGFDYEVDNNKYKGVFLKSEVITIFGEEFDNFRDALDYGSRAFRIPKAHLKDLFAENGNDFDAAIKFFQDEITRKTHEKELKEKCKVFSDNHKQNIKFVIHTVKIYLDQDQDLTINKALDKLYEIRIKK
ncbi:hypothetical protein AB6869_09675 [Rahnella rivi]|uniref:hypothetical protein n=1 Tax=Rahnella rivi TaxID=2816249 RepID=UPI0039BDE663